MSETIKCKNCGHDIVLVPTEEGKSFWFHQSELLFREDYRKLKNKDISWGEYKRPCAFQDSFEQSFEVKGIEIRHIPYCGCLKPEPKLEKELLQGVEK
jgi:hypothetical protein